MQQRLEVLNEEHHAVGPADGVVEVVPAVRVPGELAQGLGPHAEFHLVGRVVVVVCARRLRHHRRKATDDD